jgi:5-methylcytosine-specific restriction endonuclease McrA
MTKAVPHPKAPTIDHIVPWSVSKDDSRANVQLAHFLCNSLKSAGGGGEQLLLIG